MRGRGKEKEKEMTFLKKVTLVDGMRGNIPFSKWNI
jgi:hypothetical protein